MKNVKSVNLVLENCEVINIDAQYFGQLLLEKIRTKVYRVAMNSISRMQVVNRVAIELFSEANVPYDSFGEESKETIFDRLTSYNDIAQIELIYDDEGKDTELFIVNWVDDDQCGCTNKLQKSYTSKPGNLYILIGKDMKLKNFFDKEEIEDEQCMAFAKSMVIESADGDDDEDELSAEERVSEEDIDSDINNPVIPTMVPTQPTIPEQPSVPTQPVAESDEVKDNEKPDDIDLSADGENDNVESEPEKDRE